MNLGDPFFVLSDRNPLNPYKLMDGKVVLIPVRTIMLCIVFDVVFNRTLQPDSLHLAKCNLVLCPVIKFGCSRRLMAGHLLGALEPSVVLQVNRDAGCPPGVTSDGGQKTRRLGPFPNRSPGVIPVYRSSGHGCSNRIKPLES